MEMLVSVSVSGLGHVVPVCGFHTVHTNVLDVRGVMSEMYGVVARCP